MAYNQYDQRSDPYGWSKRRARQDENYHQQQRQGYQDYEYANHQYDNNQQVCRNNSQPDHNVLAEQQGHQHYHYDPRYKSRTQAPGGQPGAKQYRPNGQDRQLGEKPRPTLDDMKANTNSQGRILPAKEAPVVVAWDNPFPVFNQEKDGPVKHSSLGKDRSKMRSPDQMDPRPQTSHSYRKGDYSRPHTSQGHRRPAPQSGSHPVPSPHQIPVVGQLAPDCDTTPGQTNFSDQTLVQTRAQPSVSGHDITSLESPSAHPRQPPRSMTMPGRCGEVTVTTNLRRNQDIEVNRQGLGGKRDPQEPYGYVPTPISPISVSPVAQQANGNSARPAAAPRNASIFFEMPNFEAISPSASERTGDPLHEPIDKARPAHQKPTYPSPIDVSVLRSQPRPGLQRSQTTPANPAEFSFDLPADTNSFPQVAQQLFQANYIPTSQQSSNPQTPVAGSQKPLRSHFVAEQYPPVSANRQGYQRQASATSEDIYRTLEQTGYHSDGEAQNCVTESGPGNRGPAYGYSQADQGGVSGFQPSHRYEVRGRYYEGPPQEVQDPSQDQSQYPGQINPLQDALNGSQNPRSQTPGSVHPYPLRQYPEENTSTAPNPDALPAHPVPIRPGHLQRTCSAPVEVSTTVYRPPPATTNMAVRPTTLQKDKPPPVTPDDLNRLLQAVKSNPKDGQTALTLVKKLVEAASELSKEGRNADAKVTQRKRERYISDAHKYLKTLVDQGYADAMFYLAECYGQGSMGLRVSRKEAFKLYSSAAKAGHAQAAYRAAVCCEMGDEKGGGTRQDALKAVDWYKEAASMGDTAAIYKLGVIQLKGLLGQPRNLKGAVSYLERAAEQADRENPHALHELGLLYENGSGRDVVVRDERHALQLFMLGAELGYKFSEFRLGSAYEYGTIGCPSDAHESIAWYTRAAAQGEHQSELALGSWYFTGCDGILQQSDTEAYLWARRAASSRLAKAEYAMGYLTEVGIGCAANLDEAKKWYWRAASQNFPEARKRLEELKRGGSRKKTRVSHSAFHRQPEGECSVM